MKIHWKIVMLVAVIAMLTGLSMAVWGLGFDNIKATWIGLVIIAAVCVSWWFWVMFVIRTMMNCTEQTQRGLNEIKYDIREVRGMVRDLDFNQKR
jgi:hypothetical protein